MLNKDYVLRLQRPIDVTIGKKTKKEMENGISYFFTIDKMTTCVPFAVCSSSATFAVIVMGPMPKNSPVPMVIVSPAGMFSTVTFTILFMNPRIPPCT